MPAIDRKLLFVNQMAKIGHIALRPKREMKKLSGQKLRMPLYNTVFDGCPGNIFKHAGHFFAIGIFEIDKAFQYS